MKIMPIPMRFKAVSMELAAYLDDRYVEMHIVTESGRTVCIKCEQDSILALKQHIEKIASACPEILTWKQRSSIDPLQGDDLVKYDAAMWEGWPLPVAVKKYNQ